jgi:hypothetical protein
MHRKREQFDQPVIFVPADPQVPVVVARTFIAIMVKLFSICTALYVC